jgi:hypothetical protein
MRGLLAPDLLSDRQLVLCAGRSRPADKHRGLAPKLNIFQISLLKTTV